MPISLPPPGSLQRLGCRQLPPYQNPPKPERDKPTFVAGSPLLFQESTLTVLGVATAVVGLTSNG